MDNRRPIIFIFSFSLILMGLLLMQRNMQPKIPAGNDQDQVAQLDDQSSEKSGAQDSDQENQGQDASPAESDTENPTETEGDEEKSDDVPEIKVVRQEQFLSLGSVDPESSDRFLLTTTTQGGAIKRLESNMRHRRKNRLAYRDFEYKNLKTGQAGGYLGELELVETEIEDSDGTNRMGLRIQVVGPGTPAAASGLLGPQFDKETGEMIKPGDAIISFDDEPMITVEEFNKHLTDAHPGDSIKLGVIRDGQVMSISVDLTSKPIEILRPEPDTFGSGLPSPESFLFNVRIPEGLDWPEIDPGIVHGNWDVTRTEVEGNPALEFSYVISQEKMKAAGLAGSLTIKRIYWLPPVTEEERFDSSARNSHINMRVVIENSNDQKQDLAIQINGPTGTPTEGWWYVNKIHGRPWAIGYMAGTRDVSGSNENRSYVFFGGPEIAKNVTSSKPIIQQVFRPEVAEEQQMKYIGVDTQYFNVSLLPTDSPNNSENPYSCYSGIAALSGSTVPDKDKKLQRLADCTFLLFDRIELEPGATYSQDFEIFAGPKEPRLLDAYGLQSNRTFGWFAMFSKPLCWLLKFFYNITGQVSFGLAIIMLTVLVRSFMIPISRKAAINAQMMQALQPQMKEIGDRYKDDMEKRAQAQRDLFRRHKYNPFGGCLLMFFQLPIFIGLYRGLSVDIALRDQPLIRGMNWCSNLAAPDQLYYWKDFMPSFLAGETGFLGPYFNLLPMFTIVLFLVQQKMFTPPATDDNQKMMQKMMTFMMFFMGILFFKVPAALCLYFITSSLWGIIERKMLPKPKLSEDRLNEIGASGAEPAQASNEDKGKSKGLFAHIKDAVEQNASGKTKSVSLSADEKKRVDRERKKKMKKRGM